MPQGHAADTARGRVTSWCSFPGPQTFSGKTSMSWANRAGWSYLNLVLSGLLRGWGACVSGAAAPSAPGARLWLRNLAYVHHSTLLQIHTLYEPPQGASSRGPGVDVSI